MPKKIKVRIDKKGKMTVELEGHRGEGCLELIEKLLQGMGKVTSLEPTADYYLPAQQETNTLKEST